MTSYGQGQNSILAGQVHLPPSIEKIRVVEIKKNETLKEYIHRVGVNLFLRIVELEDLRAMRLYTALIGYTDRLDAMQENFIIWLYKHCTGSTFQPQLPRDFVWKQCYLQEIHEYYSTGNQSDQFEIGVEIPSFIQLPNPDPWPHLIETEVLYPTLPRLDCIRQLLDKKTVFIEKTPAINIQYLETMLIYSPLYIADICERFLRLYYSSDAITLELEKLEFLDEINGMSVRRLAVIYMLSYAVPGEAHKRRPPGKKQICCWCFHEGSHYTNYCVIEYTIDMRYKAALRNRTCLTCGFWNRGPDCPILNFHRLELENFDCPSCHGFHSGQVCLNPSKFEADIQAAIRNIRLIAKAPNAISEEALIGMYRKLVTYFHNNKDASNAERYRWMQIDRFDRPFHKVRKSPLNAAPRIRPRHSPPPPPRVRKY